MSNLPADLSAYGSHIAMSDLSGRCAPIIERYQKVRFRCHHCLQLVEDFCIGYPVAMRHKGKDQIEIGVKGMLSVGCVQRWAKDTMFSFEKETGGFFSYMLIKAYGLSIFDLEKLKLAPGRTELPWFNPKSTIPYQSGLEFHKHPLNLCAPNKEKIHIFDIQTTVVLENSTVENWLQTEDDFRRQYKGWIMSPPVEKHRSTESKHTTMMDGKGLSYSSSNWQVDALKSGGDVKGGSTQGSTQGLTSVTEGSLLLHFKPIPALIQSIITSQQPSQQTPNSTPIPKSNTSKTTQSTQSTKTTHTTQASVYPHP